MTVAEERARRAFDKVQANEGRGVYEFMLAEFEAGFKPDLRDYFAGQALAGILATNDARGVPAGERHDEAIARAAYILADAMLAERAK